MLTGFPSRHSAITPVLFFPAAICACAIGRQVTAHNDAGVCRRPLDRQLGSVAANERSCRLIHWSNCVGRTASSANSEAEKLRARQSSGVLRIATAGVDRTAAGRGEKTRF